MIRGNPSDAWHFGSLSNYLWCVCPVANREASHMLCFGVQLGVYQDSAFLLSFLRRVTGHEEPSASVRHSSAAQQRVRH
jgi:hypothetical protein